MDIDFKTKISTLNDIQRNWFATAVVAMVLADGDIDRTEVEFIIKLVNICNDETTVARLKKFIQFKTVPPLGPPAGIDRKIGMSMIIDLIRVAVVDMDFDPTEKAMIEKIGKSMGFSEQEIKKLVMYGFDLMNEKAS